MNLYFVFLFGMGAMGLRFFLLVSIFTLGNSCVFGVDFIFIPYLQQMAW